MSCEYLPFQKFLYENGLASLSGNVCMEDYFTSMMYEYDEIWLINTYKKLSPDRKDNYKYGKFAIFTKNNKLLKLIAQNTGVNFKRVNRDDVESTFLHIAVHKKNKDIIKFLVNNYPELRYETGILGNIPLADAVNTKDLNIIQMVADSKSKNMLDENGHKAYQRAVYRAADPKIVCFLVPGDVNINKNNLIKIILDKKSAWTSPTDIEIRNYLDSLSC